MSHRLAPLGRLVTAIGALALAIAACSGSGAPATATPAAATPAAATPGAVILPSGSSLNEDASLEAAIPNEFCGQKTIKYSFSGAEAVTDTEFAAVVQQLGRSPSDVSIAFAGVQGPECAGINLLALRIKGADQGRYEQLFIDAQEKDGGTRPARSNVGGRDVWTFTDTSGSNYFYFKGDTAFGVVAKTEADAAKGLTVLP